MNELNVVDPYLVPALKKATENLREDFAQELAQSQQYYAALARGAEAGVYDKETGEELPPPYEPDELEASYMQALESLSQLQQVLPHAQDWTTQRNVMTMVLTNGLKGVLYNGAPIYAFQCLQDAMMDAQTIHAELSAPQPHPATTWKPTAPGTGREPGEGLFDTPLRYAERAMTTHDALCNMVIAKQMEEGVAEEECVDTIYAYALDRYLKEIDPKRELEHLTDEQVEAIGNEARDVLVELLEPYHNDIPFVVCPEIAWFVVQAAREVAEDVAANGQMIGWAETEKRRQDKPAAANDNGRNFIDLAYQPEVKRRVHQLIGPILLEHADMSENLHRMTAAMDRCEAQFNHVNAEVAR